MIQNRIMKGFILLLCIDLAALFYFIGYGFGTGEFSITITSNAIAKPSYCNDNVSLQATVECLNTNFRSWWFYNISNTGKKMNESEVKIYGGVCSHSSEWYIDNLNKTKYHINEINIYSQNRSLFGHVFNVAWDDNMSIYCIIDQGNYNCQRLG